MNKELLLTYFESQIAEVEVTASPCTVNNYKSSLQSIRRFLGKDEKTFVMEDISRKWLLQYIMYMKTNRRLSEGSINCYMRVFHTVYVRGITENPAWSKKNTFPFSNINVAVPPTEKRTLSAEAIWALYTMDLSATPQLQQARDLFIFLFCARGMCFADIFKLQKCNVDGGYIKYRRSKTKTPLLVKITPEMQLLIDSNEEDSIWLFPYLHRNCYHPEKELSEASAIRSFNRYLNELGRMLNLAQPLTTYVARHSWASLAEACGMEVAYISQGLGHSSEIVTRIYMKGIPSHKMDIANDSMLDKILKRSEESENIEADQEEKERCLTLSENKTSDVFYNSSLLINRGYLTANVCILII